MTSSSDMSGSGFSDRAQYRFADIPTEPDAFLRWASQRPREEGKYELSRGVVQHTTINVRMSHARICTNLVVAISSLLDPDKFFVATADFAVRTHDGIRGPDLVVAPASTELTALWTDAPLLIAEVLSGSSVGRDFTEKLHEYRAISSLQAYMICSQDEPRVWVWTRLDDGSWPGVPLEVAGREASLPLPAMEIELFMAAIFRGIPDAPTHT